MLLLCYSEVIEMPFIEHTVPIEMTDIVKKTDKKIDDVKDNSGTTGKGMKLI